MKNYIIKSTQSQRIRHKKTTEHIHDDEIDILTLIKKKTVIFLYRNNKWDEYKNIRTDVHFFYPFLFFAFS